jgi:glycerol-3-phosphate dehydrogenase
MAAPDAEVLVIGGGATGVGVARDAAMRGLATVLVEQGQLASGTTGRFHGQLHSGARYAVRDPVSARECVREAAALRRIAPGAIEETEGAFVLLPGDDPAYPDRFVAGCRTAGVTVEELDVAGLLAREPALNPAALRAFSVPDASLDSRKLVAACARSAADHGARILAGHRVTGLVRGADAVSGATVVEVRSGEERTIHAEVVVNAAGAWARQVAALGGCAVAARLSRGAMVAVDHRIVNTVVSRCRLPADGDILVPLGAELIMGTTDAATDDPGDAEADGESVRRMVACGEELAPGFSRAGRLRAWTAVRPLVDDDPGEHAGSRGVTRSHRLFDHADRDGVGGLLTITGGKATTFRLMAEETVDAVGRALGRRAPCRTHLEPLPDSRIL